MPNKSPLLLTEEEIRSALVKAHKEAQLYGDDGEPLPEKAVVQVQHDKILQELKAAVKDCKYSKKQIWETEWNNRVLDLIARMEGRDG